MSHRLPPVTLMVVVGLLTACSGESEPSPRATLDSAPSTVAAAPSAGSLATPAVRAPAGTALERSGDRVRGLVDVGGYRLYLDCIGSGGPTVVLEAGFSGDVTSWSPVLREWTTEQPTAE